MADMGLFGLPFPEEYGGMGGDYFALCLAPRNSARSTRVWRSPWRPAVRLGAMPVYRFGNEAQKQEWLPLLARAGRLGAFGLTEPGGGSDAGCDEDDRPARRRTLGHQRQQAIHHQLGHRHHQAGHRHRGHR